MVRSRQSCRPMRGFGTIKDAIGTLDRLEREHALLADVLRLRWFHWGAMLLSLALVLSAWDMARDVSRDKERRRFEHEAGIVADTLAGRMERAGDGLRPTDGAALAGLMHGSLDPSRRLVGVAVLHGDETVKDLGPTTHRAEARDAMTTPLPVGDGNWSLALWSTPELERRARRYLPEAVLVGGLAVQGLLFALFFVQARGARRTLSLARTVHALSVALADRSASLQEANAELARANAELERFACVASHDLKAPLQGLGAQLELLDMDIEEGEMDAEIARGRIARMRTLTTRLQRLVDGVLAYSSIGGAGAEADPVRATSRDAVVDVAELVREIGEGLHVAPGRLTVAADPPLLRTDATRLEQVLSNLVTNAFKYHDAPERATVRVTCTPEGIADAAAPDAGSTVRIDVADDGPGIAAEDHERVFDLFTRVAPTDDRGTGVGLSIVRRSVEALGGSIRLDSVPGEGARFSFTWPTR